MHLSPALAGLTSQPNISQTASSTPLRPLPQQPSPNNTLLIQHNVQINCQTTLDRVIFHPSDAIVEYPETSKHGRVGHLFTLDPIQWVNPIHNFAYSLGGSRGMSERDRPIKVSLLVDESGDMVPCRVSHSTCEQRTIT